VFTKECFARLEPQERGYLMHLQMSQGYGPYGAGGYLPEDCSECGACGEPILGVGWCGTCSADYERLVAKALGAVREGNDG
jgi:hypothetical protein